MIKGTMSLHFGFIPKIADIVPIKAEKPRAFCPRLFCDCTFYGEYFYLYNIFYSEYAISGENDLFIDYLRYPIACTVHFPHPCHWIGLAAFSSSVTFSFSASSLTSRLNVVFALSTAYKICRLNVHTVR